MPIEVDTARRWQLDPVNFVRENFQAEPDPWQSDFLHAFPDNNRLAMKAAKGPGKTCTLAWAILNFLATRPDSNIAATSITGSNLRDGLWKELAKWLQRSPFLSDQFEWQKQRIISKRSPATWWVSARQWSRSADASAQSLTLAGLHADYMLFVLDESSEIPQAIMATAEAVLSSGIECKVVQSGNPTSLTGPLYRACVIDRNLWFVVEISGDPDSKDRSPRISVEWARQQIKTYGRDNPWVLVNVFGEFPPSSLNSLLGPDDVEKAMKRHLQVTEFNWAQKRLGVDVARFGDDRSVLFPRQGLASFRPQVLRKERTTDIAAAAAKAQANWGAEVILIDDTGHWGHGVIDNLFAAGLAPIGIQFNAPALDNRYKNRRAEMWLEMAKWVKRGGALPPVDELRGELIEPTYTFVNGKFLLEDKDQIKQRIGRSPDLADALALTFAIPDQPAKFMQEMMGSSKVAIDFDPWKDSPR